MQPWKIFLLIFIPVVMVLGFFIIMRVRTQKLLRKEDDRGPITILICGIHGKMGSFLAKALASDYQIVGYDTKDQASSWQVFKSLTTALAQKPSVVIDFTSALSSKQLIQEALKQKIPVISGTTGLKAEEYDELVLLAKQYQTSLISLCNFTSGIKLIHDLLTELPNGYQATISESHHHSKLDSPSGTAILLAKKVKIPSKYIISERVNEYIPKHTVVLQGNGETITLTHQVFDRSAYIPLIKKYINQILQETVIEINYEKK